jgi:hypothetical protein
VNVDNTSIAMASGKSLFLLFSVLCYSSALIVDSAIPVVPFMDYIFEDFEEKISSYKDRPWLVRLHILFLTTVVNFLLTIYKQIG